MPDIESLLPRPDGTLWVLTSRGRQGRPEGSVGVFDVFDAEGRFRHQLDLRADSPLTLVKEAVDITRQLFAGGSDVNGRVFTARGARLGWDTRPIPIYLAARGPKMLELAGPVGIPTRVRCA